MCVGGPALVYYVTPTDEALFKVPEISRSSLYVFRFNLANILHLRQLAI